MSKSRDFCLTALCGNGAADEGGGRPVLGSGCGREGRTGQHVTMTHPQPLSVAEGHKNSFLLSSIAVGIPDVLQ